ncbi:MAG TPA: acyltransferase [Acidobacteriaceae bacterium]|nr:acyltransferase [Acidobacteriaceae bacterium]
MSSRAGLSPVTRWWHGALNLSLRRVTASTRLIPQIDGLRFVAIFLVLVDHILNQGHPFMHPGGLLSEANRRPIGLRGVYLFFSLSGFVLALPYARHYLHHARPVGVAAYFRRRLTRLEPPFLVAMFGRLILFLSFSSVSTGVILAHFAAGLFYVHSVIYGAASMLNLPSWSLEIEVQFYVIAPLLALLFRIGPAWLRRAVIIALVVTTAYVSDIPTLLYNPRIFLSLAGNLQYFLAGFLVCDLYVLRDSLRARNWFWDIAAIAVFPLAVWSLTDWFWVTLPAANIVLCLAALFGRLLPRLLALSFISIVGGMCYSIYLTHNSVFSGIHALLVRVPLLISHPSAFNTAMFAIAFAAALGVGAIFFVLIERPCMDPTWPSKLKTRLTGTR